MPYDRKRILDLISQDNIRSRTKKNTRKKARGIYKKVPRADRLFMVEWAKENNIEKIDDLKDLYDNDETPRLHHIIEEFGKWSIFMEHVDRDRKEANLNTIIGKVMGDDKEYILKTIIQFKMKERNDYLRLHNERPEIVPPYHYVKKHFGSWWNVRDLAKRYSFELSLQEYYNLKRKLKRWPTRMECENNGIEYGSLLDHFDGYHNLRVIISGMEKIEDEITARNKE